MSYRKPLSERNYQAGARKGSKSKKSRFNKEQILQDYRIFTSQIPSTVPLSENDLTEPTPEKIQQVYLAILSCIQAEPVESFKQTAFVGGYSFEHPELLDDITFLLQMCRVLKKLMSACDIHDFGILDLSYPDTKRTIRNLGSLFNLLRFKSNVFDDNEVVGVIEDETELLREECQQLGINITESRHKLRDLERQREEEKELEQEIKLAMQAQQQETHTLHVQHDAAVSKYHSFEEAYAKVEQKQMMLSKELGQWTQRCEDLRGQVVTSPDKLRAALAQLDNQIEDFRTVKDETKSLLIKWESIVSNAHNVQPVIDGLNGDLTLLTDKVKKFSELESRLESTEELVMRLKQVLREATAKHQNLLRHLKLVEDEGNQAQYDGQHKIPHYNHLDSLHSDVLVLQQEMNKKIKIDADLERETMATREKIASIHKRFEKDCETLENAAQDIERALQANMKQYFELAKPITG